MVAQIIDGKKIARELRGEIKKDVQELAEKGITPGLATILVGDDPASQVYVRGKIKACEQAGIRSMHHGLPATVTEKELRGLIEGFNNDPHVHGILVQLPLPAGIDPQRIISAIDPGKDVDCFHPVNLGIFFTKKTWAEIKEENLFLPCTPHGIIKLIEKTGIDMCGKQAVIIGRSNIVGKPLALMLMAHHATVTVCHSRTKHIDRVSARADILIAAIGKAHFVTEDMVKKGAVVIDVGVNRTPEGLQGDVMFETVKNKAAWITPVPGGVGPMTITMLLANTVLAAQKRRLAGNGQ